MDIDLAVHVTRPSAPGEDLAFTTTETSTAFLVLAHLPGYGKDEVEIRVNAAGTAIGVAGARKEGFSVETLVGRLRVAHREAVEGFCQVFDVPEGVVVDRITVGFEEDDELLIVIMPKLPAVQDDDSSEDDIDVDDGDEETLLEVESTDCASSDVECDIESEPERHDVSVETDIELDVEEDEESSCPEQCVDIESEPESPGDVAVATPVLVEEPEPELTDVALDTPLEVEEVTDVAVETPIQVDEPEEPPLLDIECDTVFEPEYRELPVETAIEVLDPSHNEPQQPVDVQDATIDIECYVEHRNTPVEAPAAVKEPKPPVVDQQKPQEPTREQSAPEPQEEAREPNAEEVMEGDGVRRWRTQRRRRFPLGTVVGSALILLALGAHAARKRRQRGARRLGD